MRLKRQARSLPQALSITAEATSTVSIDHAIANSNGLIETAGPTRPLTVIRLG